MKKKNIPRVIAFIIIGVLVTIMVWAWFDKKHQDKIESTVDRAGIKISDLPAATSFDANDLFIIADAGISSKQLSGAYIINAINDTALGIRFEIDSAKTNIRSEVSGGGGAFTKSGNHLNLLVNTDTVHMGTSDEYGKLNVYGSIGTVAGNIKAGFDGVSMTGGNFIGWSLILSEMGGSGVIYSTGDDLYLYDYSNGAVKLSDLAQSGGHFTLTNSTITPTLAAYNLNIGSLNETTRKLKVNGSFEVTQDVHLGAANYDVYLNDNVNLRLDESSRILFSNTGSSDNLAIYPAGSHGLRINNYYYTNGSYLDINTNDGAYGKEITDEHNVGVDWNADSTMSFITYNGGHEATMTFNGDSIHVYNPTESLDYWIGQAVGTGAGSFIGDTVETDYVIVADSIYWGPTGLAAGSLWYTNTVTGAFDTAHTEPAYIGWEMKDLPTLEEYEADVKMINGHMERRVWYIDYETKELKSQYGWDGLGMMNTQSAYMIYHEITVRWMFEQNKKLAELERRSNEEGKAPLWRTIASIIIFIMFMILLTKQHIRLAEIESERINNRR